MTPETIMTIHKSMFDLPLHKTPCRYAGAQRFAPSPGGAPRTRVGAAPGAAAAGPPALLPLLTF